MIEAGPAHTDAAVTEVEVAIEAWTKARLLDTADPWSQERIKAPPTVTTAGAKRICQTGVMVTMLEDLILQLPQLTTELQGGRGA